MYKNKRSIYELEIKTHVQRSKAATTVGFLLKKMFFKILQLS